MRQDHRFRKQKGLTKEQKAFIPIIVLPFIAVILIVIIIIADYRKNRLANDEVNMVENQQVTMAEETPELLQENGLPEDAPEPGEEPETEETTQEETTVAEKNDPYETDFLRRDSMPELVSIMKQYFTARADADVETINTLYGITNVSVEELQAAKLRLMSNSKYISSFDDIVTYVIQGTQEDHWLVYTTANIQFYTAKTKAPMIMWCLIERDLEGNFKILSQSDLSSSMIEFVEEANHSDDVRKLAGDINAKLNHALDSDEDLRLIYGILRSGSPVYETNDEVVVVENKTELDDDSSQAEE